MVDPPSPSLADSKVDGLLVPNLISDSDIVKFQKMASAGNTLASVKHPTPAVAETAKLKSEIVDGSLGSLVLQFPLEYDPEREHITRAQYRTCKGHAQTAAGGESGEPGWPNLTSTVRGMSKAKPR